MRWGFPPPPFMGSKAPVTNIRNTASNYWKPWLKKPEQRCIVPATAFSEPDRNTSKPVQFRWFKRTDGQPFFFAGIWREWEGDRGTKAKPNVGKHKLFSFLTTEPNSVVEPIHNKAMPVLLMTPADVDKCPYNGTVADRFPEGRPVRAVTVTSCRCRCSWQPTTWGPGISAAAAASRWPTRRSSAASPRPARAWRSRSA